MEKIVVAYWMGQKVESIGYDHNEMFDYSIEKRNEIIDQVLNNGYQVMLYQVGESLCIWVDNGRFRQR